MSATYSPWRVERVHRPAGFLGIRHRLVRDVTTRRFGLDWHSVEVYRGRVTGADADRICRALNGEVEEHKRLPSHCGRCGQELTVFKVWGEGVNESVPTDRYDINPCPTCLARAREEPE